MPAVAAAVSPRKLASKMTAAPPERVRPFLKWAGSKKQLRAAFAPLYPAGLGETGYHEPFLGSGAVFFDVRAQYAPRRCTLSDNNAELMAAFTAVRDDVEAVIARLAKHQARHDERYFYEVRATGPQELAKQSLVERGARLIYLNKTCFNGLYRVNSKGLFNVPMGRYKNPAICDPELLRKASAALVGVDLVTGPFDAILERARPGDVVYFDPPYVPVSDTSYFTSYTEGSFGEVDQRRLAEIYRALDARGCRVMLSNSDTPFVRKLYRGFDVRQVMARRIINSNKDRRGHVAEVVVLNYYPQQRDATD